MEGDTIDPSLEKPNFHLLPKIINGGLAGVIGVSIVFPLDLTKVRLQNQIIGPNGERQYKNMLDCLIQTYKQDGYFGMYRGAAVNILLIAPEKAIKLASFDLFRHHLTLPDGSQPMSRIALAGAFAGCCQITVSCPMDLLKIQMQDAGRIAAQAKKDGKEYKSPTALQLTRKILREKGIFGMYRGLPASFVREVYFSIVYFPFFFWFNDYGKTEDGGPSPFWWTFMGGFLGGVASAIAVNPIDVVKTRWQTITKGKHDLQCTGLFDCFVKTYQNEGLYAFMKGIGCRIAIVAPLFGIAQTVYYIGVGEWILGLPKVL